MSLCSCLIIDPPPPSPCDSNCIYAPNMLVSGQVTACAGSTDIDISPVVAACGGITPKYTIISSKNVTGTPTITEDIITFTPANNNYESGQIVYKVSCGILSAIGKIIIVYTNNCVDTECDQYETCNKCTGLCEENDYDYSAEVPENEVLPDGSGLVI